MRDLLRATMIVLALLLPALAGGGPGESPPPPAPGGEKGAPPAKKTKQVSITGLMIMKRRQEHANIRDQASLMEVRLIDRYERIRERKIIRLTKKDEAGLEKVLIKFLEPPDLRGMAFLTWEHVDREDDRWIYLPSRRKIVRIAPSERTERFAETDFSYEDLKSENLDAHRYKLLKKQELDGVPCYVVEARPKKGRHKAMTGYSHRILWIHAIHYYALRIEYYSKKSKRVKIQHNKSWSRVNEVWRPFSLEMRDERRKHRTEVIVRYWRINEGLPDDLFRLRSLERSR